MADRMTIGDSDAELTPRRDDFARAKADGTLVVAGSSARHASRFSRRSLIGLLGLSAMSSALAACSLPQKTASPQADRRVAIVYQDWQTVWFPPMAQQMLDQFHDTHPGIRVFYTPDPEDVAETMLAAMQAGSAPDVFQGCCSFFPIWAQRKYTLDLRPYVKADIDRATIDDWDSAQYKSFFTRDGRQYGLPKYHGALALYYNRDVFDSYGISYPNDRWDYDAYLAAMKGLTHDRNGDGRTDLWGSMVDISWERLQVHVNAWGGHLVAPADSSRCDLGEPQSISALEWVRARMWDDKVMATPQDVQKMAPRDAFAAGRLAMVEDGSWALKDILAKAEFRVGVAPFPAGPVRRVSLATTDGFGIYSGTRQRDAAWELMKFLIGKDYGLAMARANFLQPARASLVDAWIEAIHKDFPTQARDVNLQAFAEGHIRGYSVTAEVFSDGMADATRLASAAWDRIFILGKSSVADEMESVCRDIQDLRLGQQTGILPTERRGNGEG
jgi:multiple sugar transport system substrate-binding protein